jgi:hypothetical protein
MGRICDFSMFGWSRRQRATTERSDKVLKANTYEDVDVDMRRAVDRERDAV